MSRGPTIQGAGADRRRASAIGQAERMSQAGHVVEALRFLGRALNRLGPDAALYSERARIHFHRRHYGAAGRDLQRAIRLSPREAALYAQKADLLAQTARPDLAHRELGRALRLHPDSERFRFARLGMLVAGNFRAEASRQIAGLLQSGSPTAVREAMFYRGCLKLKGGLRRQAAGDFMRVMGRGGAEDPLGMRARFYWLVARSMLPIPAVGGHRRRRGGPRLYLCGLGLFPPYTITLDVLEAIGRCDLLVNNVAGHETRELLSIFRADLSPATYENRMDNDVWARSILRHLRRGKIVAFVTRGHPLVYGGLGEALVRRCRALGIPCETFGAVTSVDAMMDSMGRMLGEAVSGVQVYDHKAVKSAGAIDGRTPLIVTCSSSSLNYRDVLGLKRSLERYYPGSHACRMFGPKYDGNPAEFRLADMGRRYTSMHASLMLYVPPRQGRVGPAHDR